MPPAAVLLCAASLHGAFCEERQQNIREVLKSLRSESEAERQEVRPPILGSVIRTVFNGSDDLECSHPTGSGFSALSLHEGLLVNASGSSGRSGPVQQTGSSINLWSNRVGLSLQEKSSERSRYLCSELLTAVVTSADWLLLFRSNGTAYNQLHLQRMFRRFWTLEIHGVHVFQRLQNQTGSL